jgi:hypothetical protein
LGGFRNNVAVEAREKFAKLAGIRDTWQKNDPLWIEACHQSGALVFWPFEDAVRNLPKMLNIIGDLGTILWDKQQKLCTRCAEEGHTFVTRKGTRVLMFSGVTQSSDVAEMVGDKFDLVIGFAIFKRGVVEPVMLFSTRSHSGYDCSALAKAHGGGGHTAAAGFTIVLDDESSQPFILAQQLIEAYEAK